MFGAVADPAFGARLGLRVGDSFRIGEATFRLAAVLKSEPDKLAAGIGFGPRVLVSDAALAASALVQPGSLVRNLYRISLPDAAPGRPADAAALHAFVADATKRFPEAGWEARTRENVSPQFSRDLGRFTQFLTLVGLTALVIGGVGVANAIRGFVERKRPAIATMKSLGAFVFSLMLAQVMGIALLGIAIGLAVGVALPFAVAAAFGAVLPFPLAPAVYPTQVAAGLAYGALTALAFSLGPLGGAHDVPVSALFRDTVDPGRRRLRPQYLAMIALAAFALVATVLALSQQRSLTVIYLSATAGGFVVLRLVGWVLMLAARHAPHARTVSLRLALANIHRPGAVTPSVVLSLGLGLALLVALTLIDGNIRAQLTRGAPGETPSFFFLDVQSADAPAFRDFLKAHAEGGRLEFVPMMRGRIVRLGARPVAEVKPSEKAAWVLQGDRGITFSDAVPDGSMLVKGKWWPADHTGKPLVSMEDDIADGLGLHLGDTVTVNVLGREITATIANTRKVDWRKLGINFVMVFSSDTFAGAPYSDLATVTYPPSANAAAGTGRELTLLREVATAYPCVTRLLAALLLEYGILGAATALFGVLAGSAAAYGIVAKVMSLDFTFLWRQALVAALGALAVTVGLGLAGTWRVLGRKPASYLRNM